MLEARDISFGYGSRTLYDNFSFSVTPEERVALKAPSGFGKTTLCRVLAGYEKPWAGEILVDSQPLQSFKGASPVQLVLQHPETAVDPRMRMEKTLSEAGEVSAHLKEGLGIRQEWLSRFSHELSGGELQRFCIARALAAHPRYLIADEISTMLDAQTQAQIWRFLINECTQQKIGLVFVSHSPALTERIATRVVDLSALVVEGSPNKRSFADISAR